MRNLLILFLIGLLCFNAELKSEEALYTISGYIKDASTGEDLIGANIYIEDVKAGAISNTYGFYSLSLPKGKYRVKVSYMGYQGQEFDIDMNEPISRNIHMVPNPFVFYPPLSSKKIAQPPQI